MKQCKKCLETKPLEDFYVSEVYKGKKYYRTICKECFKKKIIDYYYENKETYNRKRRENYSIDKWKQGAIYKFK